MSHHVENNDYLFQNSISKEVSLKSSIKRDSLCVKASNGHFSGRVLAKPLVMVTILYRFAYVQATGTGQLLQKLSDPLYFQSVIIVNGHIKH